MANYYCLHVVLKRLGERNTKGLVGFYEEDGVGGVEVAKEAHLDFVDAGESGEIFCHTGTGTHSENIFHVLPCQRRS